VSDTRSSGAAVPQTTVPTLEQTDLTRYDFIDFGGSKGGSVRYCEGNFSGRGIGIDISLKKVERARAEGVDVVLGDATKVDVENAVRFVSMIDFLEHLPTLEDVERALAVAARAAREFLFISHPSFEGEPYLRERGFKQYWWDWTAHPSHITVADYRAIFDRLGLSEYVVRYLQPVEHSGHPSVLPIDAPANSGPYDPAEHPPKPFLPFSQSVWRSQMIWVAVRPLTEAEWLALLALPSDEAGRAARRAARRRAARRHRRRAS
jgi:Methyltransferase domain